MVAAVRIAPSRRCAAARIAALAAVAAISGGAAAQDAAAGRWPRAIVLEQGTLLVYSPQLEKLEGVTLSGRAAVSWEAKGGKPVFGVFWFDARALVDKERRVVNVEALDVTKVRFPNATPEQEKRVERLVEAEVPKWDLTPSLDEIQAAIAVSQRAKKSEKGITATPPKLVFAEEPAVLLLYDGAPAVRPIPQSELERVVNTPLFVVRDPAASRFYLGSTTFWYEAADATGPWKPVPAPPPKVKAFFDANPPPPPPAEGEQGAAQPGPPPQPGAPPPAAPQGRPSPAAPQAGGTPPLATEQPSSPPKIIVATEPTELIVFDGKPAWVPIGGEGKLLYADNTDGNVIVHVPTNETFVLVSGRWYQATSLSGPWTAVRPDRVPAAFKSIPPDSAIGEVRAFLAGTQEAEDALADAQIPQATAVKRDQTLKVTYDGPPRFKEIEGTGMAYAVNTSFSVVREGSWFYCCHQGVWYVAPAADGPWTVSDRRPPSIEQVPASVPVYNVKYVYVYQSTPTEVYVGYLPGYVGVYPYYGTLVYGTGYYYPPYIGAYSCYPYPATFGVHVGWSPWTGFGVGVSWGTPFFSVGIHFGGYGRFYGPVGYRVPPRPAYGYRPPPAGYRARYGGYRAPPVGYRGGGAAAAGGAARTAAVASRASGANLYDRPGNVDRNVPRAQPAERRAPAASGQPNNVYGDRSGNVYRQNAAGSWERNTASGWQQAGTAQRGGGAASPAPAPAPSASLSQDAAARSRSSSAPSYGAGRTGGGGMRGGGGRGGGRR